MSIYKKHEKLQLDSMDGIWLDYKNHHWIFYIKDSYWDKEEIQRIEKGNVTISFIQKGIVDAFLLEIYDCLEPSDIPFCMKDAEGEILTSFDDSVDYIYEVVALNEDNCVLADRTISLGHKDSVILKEKLKERLQADFDSHAFDRAYEKLLERFEPYELEQFEVFSNRKESE